MFFIWDFIYIYRWSLAVHLIVNRGDIKGDDEIKVSEVVTVL